MVSQVEQKWRRIHEEAEDEKKSMMERVASVDSQVKTSLISVLVYDDVRKSQFLVCHLEKGSL